MKKKRLLRTLLLMATGLLTLPGLAQDQRNTQDQTRTQGQDSFAYRAPLDTISQAGWYRVILTPDIVAKCKEDMADIRIQGADRAYVPYVLKTDIPIYGGQSFIEFPILPAGKEDSGGDVRIGNWSGGAIHSLLLHIHPSAVSRYWTLSGSNDGEKWYIIREHIKIAPLFTDPAYFSDQLIDFPSSDYHYFRITQEDKGLLPLYISRAGIITEHVGTKRYRPLPAPMISQKDSNNHHSYVTLTFQEPYQVENLQFDIKAPRLYNRQAVVFVKDPRYPNTILSLNPAVRSFDIKPEKSRSILLDIDNEDNSPLILDKIEASQKERYLLTWLEPGKYDLLIGDNKAQPPTYDLKYFIDTVSREPAAILPGALASTNIRPASAVPPPRINKGIYLWGAIVAVLVLLVWLCLNMLKSIRESRR